MRSIGHFIGGREVKGTSGRFADVFEPMTGDVQAQVALASKAELRAAVENARAAQPEWGATNPQRRARVMMKFLELAQRDYDKLAELLAREHGKTVPDAKGDIQRGLEVVEFACGIPHLMKGEYSEGAGPGIDIYSFWISSRNLNITRARRCGLVAPQAGCAASALAMACSTSECLARATLACTSPVLGSKTSPKRPEMPLTVLPPTKWPISRMGSISSELTGPGRDLRPVAPIC